MALFRKNRGKQAELTFAGEEVRPLLGKQAYCRLCRADRQFSKAWLRMRPLSQCMCCGLTFENAGMLYAQNQPACPRCQEFLEHPGFEYGICDGCGSKFELVEGAVPGLLPNRKQRLEMESRGNAAPAHISAPPNPKRMRITERHDGKRTT